MKTTTFLLSLFLCFLCKEIRAAQHAKLFWVCYHPANYSVVSKPGCKGSVPAPPHPSQRTAKLHSRFLMIITFSNMVISRRLSVTIWKYFQNLLLNKIYKAHKIPLQNPGIHWWKQACYRWLCFHFSDFTAHILPSLLCQPREPSPASGARGSKRHPGVITQADCVALYLSFPAILSAIPGS